MSKIREQSNPSQPRLSALHGGELLAARTEKERITPISRSLDDKVPVLQAENIERHYGERLASQESIDTLERYAKSIVD